MIAAIATAYTADAPPLETLYPPDILPAGAGEHVEAFAHRVWLLAIRFTKCYPDRYIMITEVKP